MIGIIDYGAGNLLSVKKALDYLHTESLIVQSHRDFTHIEKCILPGVGAFQSAVHKLKEKGLFEPVRDWLQEDKPFLGICLGMQVLFAESEEAPGVRGYALFPGDVLQFTQYKVPQIGWNRVSFTRPSPITECISDNQYFYFLHGYYVHAEDQQIVVGTTHYGVSYPSIVSRGNTYGVQFHPEKSGTVGLSLLKNWVMKC
jgi:imidazole glycerol phosphate synthase glutamine amidotransferase subunit